ncbi:hypothetical protein ABZ401_19085 [Streptomyces sp. NPDC005892]|uniref:hypothetical protein n=1 Tax=Streptomyces sp. NPDC005892 TaxID=3155593 RepID=UPI0033DFC67A
MRSNHKTTSQTTCDYESANADPCTTFALTGHYQRSTVAEQAADHNRRLAVDGWSDLEGRDYCPDHTPVRPTP